MFGVAERCEGRLVAETIEDPFQVKEETQSRLVGATRNPVEQIGEPNNWRNPFRSRDLDSHLISSNPFSACLSFKQARGVLVMSEGGLELPRLLRSVVVA